MGHKRKRSYSSFASDLDDFEDNEEGPKSRDLFRDHITTSIFARPSKKDRKLSIASSEEEEVMQKSLVAMKPKNKLSAQTPAVKRDTKMLVT